MTQLTLKQFNAHYYYKTDLIKLCRRYNLPTYGTKAELTRYLRAYLSGIPKQQILPVRQPKLPRTRLSHNDISLSTPLVDSGFSFNREARQFFADYFGVPQFSFKKKMAVIKRKAEADHDLTMTVGDLIRAYQQPDNLVKQSQEEATYQWNHFVKAFCADPDSSRFNQKIKVAAILWHHVKRSSKSKNYQHRLLKKYAVEIQTFIK
ncbi:hypothetical protein YK48G_06600 [Lentilactobacillus fungorum]|uniref:SAP domain-containing protein n=2 Tax=Lentilactobacillus fungorum TaxID=2201250 RepID=A0ABQ3VWG3_9LACO|nr:hypothetical protein YK48G_06600 [Lentilactobacillus fungorum]